MNNSEVPGSSITPTPSPPEHSGLSSRGGGGGGSCLDVGADPEILELGGRRGVQEFSN